MSDETKLQDSESAGLSRRTVMKGAAWSVPVVMVASAAPALAASGGGPDVLVGEAKKLPGASCANATLFPGVDVNTVKGFVFPFSITNNTSKAIVITDVDITTNPLTDPPFSAIASDPALPATINPGQTIVLWVYTTGPNSGNFSTTASAVIYWGHSIPDPDNHDPIEISWFIPSFPPVTGNDCTPTFVPVAA